MTTDGQLLLRQFLLVDETAAPEQLKDFIEKVSPGRANSFAWSISSYLPVLSDGDIAHLVKVFTILENALNAGFCGGSTTQVPILLTELRLRDAEAAERLTAWAFTVAKNPYNPFGTSNASRSAASSVAEYRQLEATRAWRNSETDATRSALAKDRAAQLAVHHRNRSKQREKRNVCLRAYLAELALLGPAERLRSLIANDWHFGAIPGEYADVTAAMSLSTEEQRRLVTRLAKAPRGPWVSLCLTLEGAAL